MSNRSIVGMLEEYGLEITDASKFLAQTAQLIHLKEYD